MKLTFLELRPWCGSFFFAPDQIRRRFAGKLRTDITRFHMSEQGTIGFPTGIITTFQS